MYNQYQYINIIKKVKRDFLSINMFAIPIPIPIN